MAKKSDFCLYLSVINRKKPGYINASYERQSEIINTYMMQKNIYGLQKRLVLEDVYKAYLKAPEIMLMES